MINIAIKLGSIALAIAAEAVKAEKQGEVDAAGMASICYRGGASKVFGKNGHARDEKFSPELATDAKNILGRVLGELFDGVVIEATEYVKPEPAVNVGALRTSLAELGMDDASIDAVLAKSKK